MDVYGAPVYYDYKNRETSYMNPSTVHNNSNALSSFFEKYLLQRAMSVYKWSMPESWNDNYVKYVLYTWGYFAVINTDKFGVIPQGCGLSGYNVMYQPTHAIITNPLLTGIMQPQIDKQCVVVKMQPDYSGVMDLVKFYAGMMALCAETAGMNLVNSKLSYVFGARNKQGAESFKKMFDEIQGGNPAVFIDKQLLDDMGQGWQTFSQDLRANYIAGDILSDMRKWEERFDTEIGINTANTDKKERLITDEVNSNNFEVKSRPEMWLDTLQEGCRKASDMFGIDLYVDWREKGGPGSESNNVTLRTDAD